MKHILLLSLFGLFLDINGQAFNGVNWAVLVAGSNTWSNYRHQSDVYHAYQLVKSRGIPDSHIIVMHYDDIAYNANNPTPGKIINKPFGPDVYEGVPKHYTGIDVTPKNFLSVIKGDPLLSLRGKKVLQSGPNDNVFIYFADHGGPDLIAFPSGYLYAEDLNAALQYMHFKRKYSQLVFYIEACESGSMFEKLLPNNINIYANTAANSTQSSYSCYYDNDRKTFLGDSFSVNWLENSESSNLVTMTLQNQYQTVQKLTTGSQVMQFGNIVLSNEPVSLFLGSGQSSGHALNAVNDIDAVDAHDAPIHALNKTIQSTTNSTEREILVKELEIYLVAREFLIMHLVKIVTEVKDLLELEVIDDIMHNKQTLSPNNTGCYRTLVDGFHENCFDLNENPYVFAKLHVLVNICELKPELAEKVSQRLISYCKQNLSEGYGHPII